MFKTTRTRWCVGIGAAVVAAVGLGLAQAEEQSAFVIPKGLEPIRFPDDNPLTPEKVELGKQLYFDKRLSVDNSVSCASCHDPAKGWSNSEPFATGVKGQKGGRSAPTVLNSAYQVFQFWDGRAGSLEEQALGPIQNPIEMAIPNLGVLEKKLNKIEGYRTQFAKVFGSEEITAKDVGKAIAAFERTVLSGDAPFDRYRAGDKEALSPSAKRGMDIFFGKGHCSACHTGPNFTDNAFHNVGVGMDKDPPDLGRAAISKLEGDRGSFKTPTLRDIARTAPYMHDGSLATLEAVIEHYAKGAVPNPQLDEEIYPLKLTDQEKKDLVAFLKDGLSSSKYPDITPPKLPE